MKGYILSDQIPLFGHADVVGFGDEHFHVREIPKEQSKALIIKHHYSHKVCNDATTHIHLGVFFDGALMGCLQFGYAMNPQSGSSVVSGTELDGYKELNRMWIDDDAGQYPESRAIGCAIKYIKRKYPSVKWIQSFADERCGGLGIVYQACSFGFFGDHVSTFWEFEGETFHNSVITNNNRNKKEELEKRGFKESAVRMDLRQFRYIFFIDKRKEKDCLLKRHPYPKHYLLDSE